MTDNEKALMHQFEMASHSEGYAQFLYQLMGGGNITKDQARETMEFFIAKMKRDIEKIDFDIAIVGCGAYGMNLGAFIKRDLGKSVLHLGGMLQLLFGIKGKRWEADPRYNALYTDSWTRPLQHEVPSANARIENGCYW